MVESKFRDTSFQCNIYIRIYLCKNYAMTGLILVRGKKCKWKLKEENEDTIQRSGKLWPVDNDKNQRMIRF